MNVTSIDPVETGFIVYHDGCHIKGISPSSDPEMDEKFDRFFISIEHGIMLRDEGQVGWLVRKKGNSYQLIKTIDNWLTAEDDLSKLEDDRSDDIHLNIKIYPNRIIFDTYGQTVKTLQKFLSFVFTKKDDPSAILHVLTLSIADMIDYGFVSVPSSIPENTLLDIHTKRLFPAHRITYASSTDDVVLYLPKHFVDLMKFETTPIAKPHLQALVDRPQGLLTIKLVGDGHEMYHRSMEHLGLLFTLPDDASMVLHADSVPIDSLREGCTLKIPDVVVQRTFDLWSPLLYRHSYIGTVNHEFISTESRNLS